MKVEIPEGAKYGYIHKCSRAFVVEEGKGFLSCPFCGSFPYATKVGNEYSLAKKKNVRGQFNGIEIECSGCGIKKRIGVFRSTYEQGWVRALEHWNKRVQKEVER